MKGGVNIALIWQRGASLSKTLR